MAGLVLDESTIKTIAGDTYYYYVADIPALTQADLPWQPGADGQPIVASGHHVVIAADTVTVRGTLRNPSRDIRIFARQITFEKDAVIDVSGADPEHDYTAGDLPQQTDNSAGAAGAEGAIGSPGQPAGNISIFADTIIGPAEGEVTIATTTAGATSSGYGAIVDAAELVLTQIPESKQLGDARKITIVQEHVGNLAWPVDFTSLVLSGTSKATAQVDVSRIAQGSVDLTVVFPALTLAGQMTIILPSLAKTSAFAGAVSARATVHFSRAENGTWPAEVAAPVVSGLRLILNINPDFVFSADALAGMIATALSAALEPLTALAIAEPPPRLKPLPAGAVVLRANGGRGGRGQDGHPGIKGAQGDPGAKTDEQSGAAPPSNSIGGTGRTGGAGGTAGASGDGSHGGQIQLGFRRASGLPLAVMLLKGAGGGAATGGEGGAGGDGGTAGSYVGVSWQNIEGVMVKRTWRVPSTPGPLGKQGHHGARAAIAAAGAAGSVVCNGTVPPDGAVTTRSDYPQLALAARVPQLLITQHTASLAYLNARSRDEYSAAAVLFVWLARITAPAMDAGFAPRDWTAGDIDTARSLHGFAQTACARLRSGIDFFGHPKNWVPTFTLASYLKRIREMIDLGNIVEQQYQAFITERNDQDTRMAALKGTRDKLQSDLANVAEEQRQLIDTIGEADRTIADLTARLQVQTTTIANDQFVFQQEFIAKIEAATKCSFSEVVSLVGAIATIVGGAADGVGAIAGAADTAEVAKEAESALKQAQLAITQITTVTATIESIQGSIDTIRDMFPTNPSAKSVGLLVTDKEKFDNLIDEYVDDPNLPEAAVLKAAVDDFFAMIEARNQAILAYAALFTQEAQLNAKHAQIVAQIGQVDTLMPTIRDPNLLSYLSFMRSAYANAKTELVSRLYEAHRALVYWTIRQEAFAVNDLDIATLTSTLSQLEDEIDDAKLRQGKVQHFANVSVEITAANLPLAFRALPRSKKLVFSISPQDPVFAHQYQVLVSDVAIELPELTSKTGKVFLSINHSGSEVQVGNNQVNGHSQDFTVAFTHAQRKIPYTIDFADPNSKIGGEVGDDDFYGLSPFAAWTLDFDFNGNEWVDLTRISRVRLVFTGSFFGPA